MKPVGCAQLGASLIVFILEQCSIFLESLKKIFTPGFFGEGKVLESHRRTSERAERTNRRFDIISYSKTSSLRPFGPALGASGLLEFVLRALRALRPCDPRNGAMIVNTLSTD